MTVRADRVETREPAERGRLLGRRHAAAVRRAIDDYTWLFAARGLDVDAPAFADATALATRAWAPGLADEIEGWAVGADVPAWQVWMLNARTELMAVAKRQRAGAGAAECSTAVHLPADGSAPRTVQTWDWIEPMASEALVVALTTDAGRRVVTFTEAGVVGKIGVAGDPGGAGGSLGLHFNILNHASDGVAPAVPVHVVARRILEEATSIDDAVALARSAPLAASTVFTVSTWIDGVADAASIEVAPAGVAVLPADADGFVLHTNLFLDEALAAAEGNTTSTTSRPRLASLDAHRAAIAEADPMRRAAGLALESDGSRSPVCAHPEPGAPADDRWESKLTIALDLERVALGFTAGGPDAVTAATWRTLDADLVPDAPFGADDGGGAEHPLEARNAGRR